MNLYVLLITLGVLAVGLSTYLPFVIPSKIISFVAVIFSSVLCVMIASILTKKWMEDQYDQKILKLKDDSERRIRRLKREHDTTTLEKTIRDGTQTLIKNALDYFKIENIKNEIGTSAAIENLQLDKYGQIIELLADFSLILPDIKENQRIVEDEINHQIKIYQIDENPFALFLERINQKYTISVNKKIKERLDQELAERMSTCPHCAERIMPRAKICKHCGKPVKTIVEEEPQKVKVIEIDRMERGRRLYQMGRYQEAIREFTAAIDLKIDAAAAYYNRAMTYHRLGNRKQAEADIKEAAQRGHKKALGLLSKIEPASSYDQA